MNIKSFVEKLLAALRVKTLVGGLEISDSAMRFIYFDGREWKMILLRLPPGVLENGQVKNREKFIEAVKALRNHIPSQTTRHEKTSVVVVLNSVNVYSQVFSLPLLEGESLNQAIQLNVQMISPIETSQAYSGWQLVSKDQSALRLEILSAYINRQSVDEMSVILKDAGFLPVAVESRALALMRLLRELGAGFDANNSYIVLNLDNAGSDFLIARRGQLYFEYFTPWKDLSDEKGQISIRAFETAILRNLHQVVNFYNQRWPEPISGIFISATTLNAEVEKIVKDNFSLKVMPLKLKAGQSIEPDWFVVLGAGLRGIKPRRGDKEISLLGIGAEEEFHREQIINFFGFWRILLPVSLAILVIIFSVADLSLSNMRRSLESRSIFRLNNEQVKEIADLKTKVGDFNRSVALIKSVEQSKVSQGEILEKIQKLVQDNEITLNYFRFRSYGERAVLSGQTKTEDKILNFKKALSDDSGFKEINLPLTEISRTPQGFSFSISFLMSPATSAKTE